MSNCCNDSSTGEDRCQVEQECTNTVITCPSCGESGKTIDLISVKSMLVPKVLSQLDVHQMYRFCASPNCKVVYFGSQGATFIVGDVRVAVFQKDLGEEVNACYCFGWTRAKIADEIRLTRKSTAVASINAHIRAGRCGCEVNNPQGSCCLGNVSFTVKEVQKALQIQ